MKIPANSINEYLEALPEDRTKAIQRFIKIFEKHLPAGFEKGLNYGMPSFYVPHSRYPDGYHCDPKLPLPFINIASQKNFVALYHMGIYATPELLEWWQTAYPKHAKYKLDMGKSCVRFKRMDDIPWRLVEELAQKITPEAWIATYESSFKK